MTKPLPAALVSACLLLAGCVVAPPAPVEPGACIDCEDPRLIRREVHYYRSDPFFGFWYDPWYDPWYYGPQYEHHHHHEQPPYVVVHPARPAPPPSQPPPPPPRGERPVPRPKPRDPGLVPNRTPEPSPPAQRVERRRDKPGYANPKRDKRRSAEP